MDLPWKNITCFHLMGSSEECIVATLLFRLRETKSQEASVEKRLSGPTLPTFAVIYS